MHQNALLEKPNSECLKSSKMLQLYNSAHNIRLQIWAKSFEHLKTQLNSQRVRILGGPIAPKRNSVFKVCLPKRMASTTLALVCISLQMPRVCPFTISAFSGSRSAPKLKVVLGGGADKCPPYQIHFQTNFSPKKKEVGCKVQIWC